MGSPSTALVRWLPRAGVWLWFVALSVGLTWAVWQAPGTVVGGFEGPDLAGTAWTWWWTSFSLQHGMNPAHCTFDYFPVGYRPVAMYNLLDAFLVAPLYWLFEPVRAYNLGVTAILTTVGLAGYQLSRWMGSARLAALFGGTVLMTTSFTLGELWAGRPGQAMVTFLALALGLWVRLFRGELPAGRWGWGWVGLTALTSALTFLGYWYYGMFLGMGVALVALVHVRHWRPPVLSRAGVATALVLLLVLPFVALLLQDGSLLPGLAGSDGWMDQGELGRGEAGLNWALDSGMWLGWVLSKGDGLVGDRRILYSLAIIGLAPVIGYRRRRGVWLLLLLFGWSLTLGPYAKGRAGEVLAEVPLPYLWFYDYLPFFSRFWWPARFQALMCIALAVLASLNITDLARDLGRWGRWIAPAAILLWGVESWNANDHFPLNAGAALAPTSAYSVLDGPALTLPVFGPDGGGRFAIWLQMFHEQPVLYGLGGHVNGHRPAGMDRLVEQNSLLRVLRVYEWGPPDGIHVSVEDVDALLAAGFRWVILDRAFYQPARAMAVAPLLDGFLTDLLGPPRARDPRTVVWALHPIFQDYSLAEGEPPPLPEGFDSLDDLQRLLGAPPEMPPPPGMPAAQLNRPAGPVMPYQEDRGGGR